VSILLRWFYPPKLVIQGIVSRSRVPISLRMPPSPLVPCLYQPSASTPQVVQKGTAGDREKPYCLDEALMEILYFDAIIIGLAQRMSCKVRAVRQTSDNNCTDSGHAIIEDAKTDRLPNGDYDVQIEGRQFAFKRKDGKFSLR
jgi:hypothetical protein